MAENKTRSTDASVDDYIPSRANAQQQADCRELMTLFKKVTREGQEHRSLLSRLGKHRMTKSCLYFKQLADLDKSVLEKVVVGSAAEVRRRYGQDGRGNI